MPQETLFINQNGRATCGQIRHAGAYLAGALEAQPGQQEYTTPLDHWVAVTSTEAATHGIGCEDCEAGR